MTLDAQPSPLVPAGDAAPAPDAPQPATAPTLRVLTYNILAGGGPRLDAIEQVIRAVRPDVVGLQEVLRRETLSALARCLDMYEAFAPSPSGWHVGALSRWPVLEERGHGGPWMKRGLLEMLVQPPDGAPVRLFVLHLRAFFSSPRAGEAARLRELDYVLERMRDARVAREPHLVLGDFNSLAPGERLRATTLLRHVLAVRQRQQRAGAALHGHPSVHHVLPPLAQPFGELLGAAVGLRPIGALFDGAVSALAPRAVITRMGEAGYADCYAAHHPDPRARAFTCPLPNPAGRIDYIFASPALAARLDSCEVVADAPGCPVGRASDHAPMIAEFRLGA
ncbi:MAG TPA: endonuclease/exonuclease/phosphatase family protein [Steroidobacteraceae bacterium]|nr:endonuclease/exonuclease/phosphatase family protein [Steroidobacteraceae bacterium]